MKLYYYANKDIINFTCRNQLAFLGCKSSDRIFDSVVIRGNNNFVIYKPDKSTNYYKQEIEYKIEYHINLINEINNILYECNQTQESLNTDLGSNRIKRKEYLEKSKELGRKEDELNKTKSEAEQALELWRQRLHANMEDGEKGLGCYRLNVKSEYFGFRTRILTSAELRAVNGCRSIIYADGSKGYENMNSQNCIEKKRIDDETELGLLANGQMVYLLSKEGRFFKVKNPLTNEIGFMAGKYAGISTLVSVNCD